MPIILVGHSRGGAICIYVARKLDEQGIKVHAMLLFDAVRRATQSSIAELALDVLNPLYGVRGILFDFFGVFQEIDRIPKNVKTALHLTRKWV